MGMGAPINLYLWCAAGAAIGWIAAGVMGGGARIARVESVLVGVFGAVLGGDFVGNMVLGTRPDANAFDVAALVLAAVCGLAAVLLLAVMRRAVGPLKNSKSRNRNS
jgi:uncharacterized membrane protein YeaQ/YmgE (transglycosylase-associated protein family)